jgi:hypothetical protein
MTTEEKIIQILNEWEFGATLKSGEFIRGVKKEYYKDIAEEIVNQNLHIQPVVKTVCSACSGSGRYCEFACGSCGGTGEETD